ncbi:MAG: LLM class flavin-dependent oxidoreductase [Candidatus Dormibacteria bacterium]
MPNELSLTAADGEEVTFGVMIPWLVGLQEGLRLCRTAEELGFHSVWTGDHVLWWVPFPDPFQVLAAAAAVTSRVQLGTGVLLAALRAPVLVAKQIASLDWLTDGRVIAGMGIGGENPAEFEAAGVPLSQRSGRLDETIEVCRRLWRGEAVEHHGRYLEVQSPALDLLPSRPPAVWIGGRRELSLRRAALLGDGWLAFVVTPERYGESMASIREQAAAAERDLAGFRRGLLVWTQLDADTARARADLAPLMEAFYQTPFEKFERFCVFGNPEDYAAGLRAYIDAGVRHFNLSFAAGDREGQLRQFSGEVVPRLRSALTA